MNEHHNDIMKLQIRKVKTVKAFEYNSPRYAKEVLKVVTLTGCLFCAITVHGIPRHCRK